jgi:hypothetical protein
MEEKVFPLPAVAEVLKNMVEARLHTDGSRNIERIHQLQRDLTGSIANPYYVIVDPTNERKLRESAGASSPGNFANFLRGPLE